MKKFSVLIALVLLAVAGTGYAVTCAYDNVPAATLLVPYWKVSLNGATGYPIPSGGTDTLVSIVNVSTPGVIAHVTVWNKYSKAVIDFNIPLTGKDVVSFSMRDIMNGKLSPNLPQYDLVKYPKDPCGITNAGLPNVGYAPSVGFGKTQFIRFSHPDSANLSTAADVLTSISQYNNTLVDAIGGPFRAVVWNSLDESGDITTFTTSSGANILDGDNPACGWTTSATLKDALSGYLTIDVVNYCTNYFPDQAEFYTKDAIATAGWTQSAYYNSPCTVGTACAVTYTPNVLIGDVFYVDSASQGGNVSGDPAVAIEFDSRLGSNSGATKTFFGKFVFDKTGGCPAEITTGCTTSVYTNGWNAGFVFPGDGREPLGDRYGFRYLADQANGLQSWITVWRSDYYAAWNSTGTAIIPGTDVNLCAWADPDGNAGANDTGLYDTIHQVQVVTYDNDENVFAGSGVPPGPSGPPLGSQSPNYIFLETQRINLLTATDWNPSSFKGGWVDLTLHGLTFAPTSATNGLFNQGWVGVQHTAPGAFISVGHAAANLDNQFQCVPNAFQGTGTVVSYNPNLM